MTGRKDDIGKPRWSLVPWDAMEPVVRVLTQGAERYGDNNWTEVENAQDRYLSAAFRHLTAYAQDAPLDLESGQPHLAHAICCLLFLLALDERS